MKSNYCSKIIGTMLLILCLNPRTYPWIQPTVGANAFSTGHCSVSRKDLWGIFNNQAALAYLRTFQAGFSTEQRFLLRETAIHSIGLSVPFRNGSVGCMYSKQGFPGFSRNHFGIAAGMMLSGKFSAGVRLSYVYTSTDPAEYALNEPGISAGCIFDADERLSFAFHSELIYPVAAGNRILDPALSHTLGIRYDAADMVRIMAEVYKQASCPPGVRIGLEFEPGKKYTLSAGCQTNPFFFSFGVSFTLRKGRIDAGSGIYQFSGVTPAFSATFINE